MASHNEPKETNMYTALYDHLGAALASAKDEKAEAGRSERGRQASIIVTKLEETVALTEYYKLNKFPAAMDAVPGSPPGEK